MQQRHPGFAHYFFVYQHFERFAAGGFNNAQPWWFFVVVVPLLTLPWSLWLLRSTFGGRRGETSRDGPGGALMWMWLARRPVFFSIPQSKPVGYAMPVLFPIASLIAEPARSPWRARQRRLVPPGRRQRRRRGRRSASARSPSTAILYDRDNTALGARAGACAPRAIRSSSSPSTSSTSRCMPALPIPFR